MRPDKGLYRSRLSIGDRYAARLIFIARGYRYETAMWLAHDGVLLAKS